MNPFHGAVQPAWRVRDPRAAATRRQVLVGPGLFMRTINLTFTAAFFAALFCGTTPVRLEAQPTKSTYQISSGTYSVFGGLGGSVVYPLPSDEQAFIVLTVDSVSGSARVEIVGRDSSSPFLVLTNGVVTGNQLRFHSTGSVTSGVPAIVTVDYWVTNNADSLALNGSTSLSYAYPCNDCEDAFVHRDVQASLMPLLSIRISEVELCWSAASNQTYQVQYSSNLRTNKWTDLGPPVQGDGLDHCTQDKVAVGDGNRLYRVMLLP